MEHFVALKNGHLPCLHSGHTHALHAAIEATYINHSSKKFKSSNSPTCPGEESHASYNNINIKSSQPLKLARVEMAPFAM